MTPFSRANIYRRYIGCCSFHLQGGHMVERERERAGSAETYTQYRREDLANLLRLSC